MSCRCKFCIEKSQFMATVSSRNASNDLLAVTLEVHAVCLSVHLFSAKFTPRNNTVRRHHCPVGLVFLRPYRAIFSRWVVIDLLWETVSLTSKGSIGGKGSTLAACLPLSSPPGVVSVVLAEAESWRRGINNSTRIPFFSKRWPRFFLAYSRLRLKDGV